MDNRLNRVVVTGIGLVTPCGVGIDDFWSSMEAGRSGVAPITQFDASEFHTRIAAEVKDWDPVRFIEKRKVKEMDRFIEFAMGAAHLAVQDAQLELTEEERDDAACLVGVGMGGLGTIERCAQSLQQRGGGGRMSPYSIPSIIPNMAAGQISIRYGLRGACACLTNACASGANALGAAMEAIRLGRASVAIAGGAEATVTPIGIGAFQAMFALSRRNDEPTRASRPFDKGRDGFVCGEGAALLVLEPLERAKKRGAKIYAEMTGYGMSSDAYHAVQPAPEGRGARRSMLKALASAGLDASQVDYLNAHGTSTPQGDAHECKAILSVFGDHAKSGNLWVSSTKSMTGHLLGAAGALEAAVCALSCERGVVPPTINVDDQDPECALDVVPNEARRRKVRHALSNSFGFGGSNASVVFSRLDSM